MNIYVISSVGIISYFSIIYILYYNDVFVTDVIKFINETILWNIVKIFIVACFIAFSPFIILCMNVINLYWYLIQLTNELCIRKKIQIYVDVV